MKWTDENTKDSPCSYDMDGEGTPFRWAEDIIAFTSKVIWDLDLFTPFTNEDGDVVYIDIDQTQVDQIEILDDNGFCGLSWLYTSGALPPPDKSDWNTVYEIISTPGFTEEDLIETGWSLEEAYEMDRAIDANRYFIGNGAAFQTQRWDKASNWSASSGGAGGAGVPTASDDVFYDGNSGNSTIDLVTADCLSFSTAGYTGSLDISGNNLISAGAISHTGGTIVNSGFVETHGSFTMTATWTDAGGTIDIDDTGTWNATLTTTSLEWDAIGGTITVTGGNTITVVDNFSIFGDEIGGDVTVTAGSNFTIDLGGSIATRFGDYVTVDHMQLGAGDTMNIFNGTDSGNNDADITFATADRAANATGAYDDDAKWDGGNAPVSGDTWEIPNAYTMTIQGAEACADGFISGILSFDGQSDSVVASLTMDSGCDINVSSGGTISTTGTGTTGYALLAASSTTEIHQHSEGTITLGTEFHFDNVHTTSLTIASSEKLVLDDNCTFHDGFTVSTGGNLTDGGNVLDIETGAISIASGGYTATGTIQFLGDHLVSGAGLSFNTVVCGASPGDTTYQNDVNVADVMTINGGDTVTLDCQNNDVAIIFDKVASQPTFTLTDNDALRAVNNGTFIAGIEGNATYDVAVQTGTIDFDYEAGNWELGEVDIQVDQTTGAGSNAVVITMIEQVTTDALTIAAGDSWDTDTFNLTSVKAGAANCMIVNGTITFGSGTHSIGATTTHWGISIGNGATVDEETATMSYGPVNIGNGATHTLTTGTTTVVSSYTGIGDCFNVDAGATMDYTGNELIFAVPNACSITNANATDPQDLTVNNASCVLNLKTQNLEIANDLTITSGTLDTEEAGGTDRNLTVTRYTSITDTLDCNGSTISLGSGLTAATRALTIYASGIFTGGSGTHTIGNLIARGNSTITFTSGTTTIDGSFNVPTNSIAMYFGSGGSTPTAVNHSNGTITYTYAGVQALGADTAGQNMTLYNFIINNGSSKVQSSEAHGIDLTLNSLTITAGEFDTEETVTGTDRDLTVTNLTNITGILTCNGSTIYLGDGVYGASYSLTINAGGVFDGGSGSQFIGSINNSETLTLSSDTTRISSAESANDVAVFLANGKVINDSNGLLVFTRTGDQYLGSNDNTAQTLYDFTVNKAGGTLQYFNGKGFNLTANNDFETTVGTFNTSETVSGTSRNFTVEGNYTNAGTSTWNDSVITLGTVSAASTLANSGTVNVDTSTIYAASTSYKYIVTTGDLNWDSSGGTCNTKWGDIQVDVTTGGGGINVTIDGDMMIDGWVTSSGDTITCTTDNVVILQAGSKFFDVYGSILFNGSVGNEILCELWFGIVIKEGSTIDLQYVKVNSASAGVIGLYFWANSTMTITQIDNCYFKGANAGMLVRDTSTIPTITNCEFVGSEGAGYDTQDVSIYPSHYAQLDTCTYTTIGLFDNTSWLMDTDGSSNYTAYGTIGSSETPTAGFRAADVTGDLTTSQADVMNTPFNTSYTLGAAMANVNTLTTDASTQFLDGGFDVTVDTGITNNGTYTQSVAGSVLSGTAADKPVTSAGTWNWNTCTLGNLDIQFDVTTGGGTISTTLNNPVTANSWVTSVNDTLLLSANTLTIDNEIANYAFNNLGTLTHGNGAIVITTAATTRINSGGDSLYDLTVNHASCDLKVDTNNLAIANDLTVQAGILDTEEEGGTDRDLAVTGDIILVGTLDGNASGISAGSMTIGATATYTATSGTTTITSKDGSNISWSLATGGTFTHSSGIVDFTGVTGIHQIMGSSTFDTLRITVASACTYKFEQAKTTTVTTYAHLNGASGQLLTLDSVNGTGDWAYTINGTQDHAYLSVDRSDASGGTEAGAAFSTDVATNTNWLFGGAGEFIWDGGGGDNLASTGANWMGDAAPGVGGSAQFQAASTKACTWDVVSTSGHIDIGAGYSTGTITLGTAVVWNSMNLDAGTLDASAYALQNTGQWVQSGGTFTIDGTTALNFDDDLVLSGGTFGTDIDYTMDLEGIVNMTNGVFNLPNESGTFTMAGLTWTNSAGTLNGNDGIITFDKAGTTTLQNDLDTSGITIGAATTFDANGKDLTLDGNWDNSAGGTYTHNTNLVTFDGTTQTIDGDNTWSSFTKTVAAADTLTIEAGSTQTFEALVTLEGAAGQLLSLVSDTPGTRWDFTMTAAATKTSLTYLSVKDSDASNSDGTHLPIAPTESTNAGNTISWFSFVADSIFIADADFIVDDEELGNPADGPFITD